MSLGLLSVPASAQCVDPNGRNHAPVANPADDQGFIKTVYKGTEWALTGHKPGTLLCRNLFIANLARQCKVHRAYLHEDRDPKTCKGLAEGHRCVHYKCEGT